MNEIPSVLADTPPTPPAAEETTVDDALRPEFQPRPGDFGKNHVESTDGHPETNGPIEINLFR
jgi:hypothetical protein